MSASEIIDKLASYYHRNRPDLVDPQVNLDWVNTIGWEIEIYACTLTSGKPGQRQAVQLSSCGC